MQLNIKAFFLILAGWALLAGLFLGSLVFVVFSVALCLSAGHPQLFYYTALFCSVYVMLFLIAGFRSGSLAPAVRGVAVLAAGGVLGTGLLAYLLLPQIAEFPLVSRDLLSYQ